MNIIHTNISGFSDDRKIVENPEMKEKIITLQNAMMTMPSTMNEFRLTHHFAPKVYAREMFLPKENIIIGKTHRHSHLNIIQSGKVKVLTEEGVKEFVGPCVFTSCAGTKRSVYTLEDTIWITIHVTDETDLLKIEEEIIVSE